MTAYDVQNRTCLDIAIDHRVIALFKSVESLSKGPSEHVSRLQDLGRSLRRSQEEIQVTRELAGPAVKGGIAITLQQPRSHHPFDKGTDFVIQDCVTLRALDEVFRIVSCGTLDIRSDICVVDLLPFESRSAINIDDECLMRSFRESAEVIFQKEPDVVLCAGKIRLSDWRDHDGIKGLASNFETIGVGRAFDQASESALYLPKRVNVYHPSFAMNRHPHISLFRQLLILACAEACGLFRDDWVDKDWMVALRSQCERLAQDVNRGQPSRYIPDYQLLYLELLEKFRIVASSLLHDTSSVRYRTEVAYSDLLGSELSGICNDASLVLGRMHSLCKQGWPRRYHYVNERALIESTWITNEAMQGVLQTYGYVRTSRLSKILKRGAESILGCCEIDQARLEVRKFILLQASHAFLEMATNTEALLSDLLLGGEVLIRSEESEDVLLTKMDNLFVTERKPLAI